MNSGIELLRIVAVILITFTHTRNNLEDGYFYFFIEKLPTYGTSILSIISGYLYFTITRKSDISLFKKKIQTLAIPFLIANLSVLLLVLVANFLFNVNPLNRLTYDYSLVSQGIFALESPPINPPTYFIRDIFVIFCFLSLFTQKEFKALSVIIFYGVLGVLLIRWDILILFSAGVIYAKYKNQIKKSTLISAVILIIFTLIFFETNLLKYVVSALIFVSFVDLKFKFYNTGRYSYLLHLYHSPIIVTTFPIINQFIKNPYINVVTQILIAAIITLALFYALKKIPKLRIITGGR